MRERKARAIESEAGVGRQGRGGKKCFGRRVIATCDDGAGQNGGKLYRRLTLRKCLFCHCGLWSICSLDGSPGRRRQTRARTKRIKLRERDVARRSNRTLSSTRRPRLAHRSLATRLPLSLSHHTSITTARPIISFSAQLCRKHTRKTSMAGRMSAHFARQLLAHVTPRSLAQGPACPARPACSHWCVPLRPHVCRA